MQQLTLVTHARSEMIDITRQVAEAVETAGFDNGFCLLFVPHTTAGITINENADPSVGRDILMVLSQMVPWKADYQHQEGNSPAHVKSSLMGSSQWVAIENGRLVLGSWQGIFFCEFDGPRTRKLHLKFITSMPA